MNAPFIEKLIGGIIVVGGVEAKVFNVKVWRKLPELGQRDEPRNTIMAVCANEPPVEGQIDLKLFVVTGNRIQGIAVIPGSKITIPTVGRVGVGKFPVAFAVINSIFTAVADLDPMGG